MNKWQQKRIQRWGRIRKKGKRHYIIFHGVIGYGVAFAILYYFIDISIHYLFGLDSIFLDDRYTMFSLIVYPLLGIPLGLMYWHQNEKYFYEHQ